MIVEQLRAHMKKCTYCGKEYPDEAEVCAIDHKPLKPDAPTSSPKREWLRVLLIPFQIYVPGAFFLLQYAFRSSSGKRSLYESTDHIIVGYDICFLVLLFAGFVQIFTGKRASGFLNVGLAALCALLSCALMAAHY
jgi:hypothetical protein